MTKPVIPSAPAERDIEDAIDYYAKEAGEPIALGFLDALETAFRGIGTHPAAGSPRYAYELDLPGLRTRALMRFPYLIFYMEHPDHVAVWRVLHAQRDIPAWMQEPQE